MKTIIKVNTFPTFFILFLGQWLQALLKIFTKM